MKRAFVAGNHKCWFSTPYKDKTVNEVLKLNPNFLKWCVKNLHHLKFATALKERIKNA